MTARVRHITFDCREPYRLARFWGEVLGFVDDPDNPNAPDDPEALIVDPTGHHPGLLFVPVPGPKTVKNRVHLDLRPEVSRDEMVERVLALGGTVVADRRAEDGSGWVVMADPEGNELCVERSAAERDDVPAPIDTGVRPFPPVRTAGERELLTSMLDWYRDGVVRKVEGLRQHHAVARPLRSETSVAGIVKHLALVEDGWFSIRFAGRAGQELWPDLDEDREPDWDFRSARDEPLALNVARYQEAVARSRAVTEAYELDDVCADPHPRGEFTLRFALVHMIEETARHLGHLDILCEHLDGRTGE